MEITETGNGQQPIRQTARAPRVVNRGNIRSAPESKTLASPDVTKATIPQDQVIFGRLQAINEQANREAQRMRLAQRKSEMKEEEFRIIKNYPPYPSDDAERVKFLMSFNGLKREIEQMTIPPDSKWLGTFPGESSLPPEIALAPMIESSEDSFPGQQAINTESQLPEQTAFPMAPEDAEGVSNDKLVFLGTIGGKDLDLSIPGEAEALDTSTKARQELAGTMNGSLTAGQSPLLALMG